MFLRAAGVGGVLIQYGCIAHCTLEFVGDFVVVSIFTLCDEQIDVESSGSCINLFVVI